ncbi:putative ribonucleoside-diphosphate reductase subunit alpha [Xanthomonas phage DES1]|nr:putative ribonucleoside-diphosphate reductase subunit alpha [Xanthomonas phage DES1]
MQQFIRERVQLNALHRTYKVRRGSWAGYIPIDHGDFYEVVDFMEKEPDDVNIGWNISDEWLAKLNTGDEDARKRFSRALKAKLVTGKGYFFFPDKANRKLPVYYPISVKASNLCVEIVLPSDEQHSFSCVLSSMNVAKYDEWKDTDAIFTATVFLDCVASEFITRAKGIPGLENVVRFTEKARALGLGVCGFATYLQSKRIPFDSLDAVYFNQELFEKLDKESLEASQWMGREWGIPAWSEINEDGSFSNEPTKPRNCSRLAVAPTKSTALIMGGISEGINPDPAMIYNQSTAGGEVARINPVLLQLMKDRNVYDKKHIQEVVDKFGSVQHVSWLSDEEKKVFRTAFEYDQKVLVRLAAQRGKWLDQWQSVNLFFSAEEDPKYIVDVHKEAFNNEAILGLYYIYSKSNVGGSKDREECVVCG